LICVGRKFIPESPSPFYPPRARWYSAFYYLGNAVRRRLALDRFALPREMKASDLLLGFFVPGLAVHLRGPRILGRAALATSALLVLVYIICIGYPTANLACCFPFTPPALFITAIRYWHTKRFPGGSVSQF